MKKLVVLALQTALLFILLPLFVIGMGLFGLSLSLLIITLTAVHPPFRQWLAQQPAYTRRTAKLPGLNNAHPIPLALYLFPISLLSTAIMLTSITSLSSFVVRSVLGIFGLLVLYNFFVAGWGLADRQSTSPDWQAVRRRIAQSRFVQGVILLSLVLPFGLGGVGYLTTPEESELAEQTMVADSADETGLSAENSRTGGSGLEVAVVPNATATEEGPTPSPTATSDPTATAVPPTRTPLPPTQTPPPPTPMQPQAIPSSNANVRTGPSTDYPVIQAVGSGELLPVTGINEGGTWVQIELPTGQAGWISQGLVSLENAATVPVVTNIPPPPQPTSPPVAVQPTATTAVSAPAAPTAVPEPTQPPAPSAAQVVIVQVNKQAEYVVIRNNGGTDQDLGGWRLYSEKGNQDCRLSGVLPAGASLTIWAMSEDSGQGGFNCGFGGPIWNNQEYDPAVLFDAAGNVVDRQ